ncbi:MAG: DUF4261 domain-containing protein [Gemmataceae bacterium]|nr:DUF4261 domain-containing protein [Gemmataceae bacterium]
MAKGLFTQGVSLLTNGQTTIENIKAALLQQGFEIAKQVPAQENWAFGGPTLVVAFLPDVNGYVAVDVVNEPWPDSMGDPKSDSITFAAWSMGHFGPLAFPGSLARARQHAWAWQPAQSIPEGHRGFIRLRTSYVFGANKDTPVMPADYDPVAELMFLSEAATALLKAPGVLCYFNPNGEVLRDYASFRQVWDPCTAKQKLPLPLWMNIRFFNLSEKLGFMDTVGNGQLEIQDVEAVFPFAKYDPGDIDYYLRNVTLYLLGLDCEMMSGEEIDGPGENNLSWTMEVLDQGVIDPPRRVLRLYPKASATAVREALSAVGQ